MQTQTNLALLNRGIKIKNSIYQTLTLCIFARQSLPCGNAFSEEVWEPAQRAALPLRETNSYFQSPTPQI
ncbi:hypothetical protein H6G69_10235 [Nostoc sp. FACHB-110]|nr:hypothetical protein [Nostoc sp. FACHB-110]